MRGVEQPAFEAAPCLAGLAETGRQDDRSADPFLAALADDVGNHGSGCRDHREIDRGLHLQNRRVAFVAGYLVVPGVDRDHRAVEGAGRQVLEHPAADAVGVFAGPDYGDDARIEDRFQPVWSHSPLQSRAA